MTADGPLYVARFPAELHDYLATLGASSKAAALKWLVGEARARGWSMGDPPVVENAVEEAGR